MNDRPTGEPNQRRSLGQKGEWETIPFGGHSRVRNQEVHNCGHNRGGKWEEDVACHQRHREVLKGSCQKGGQGHEVLRAEREVVSASMD